jgi:hypothetical protein
LVNGVTKSQCQDAAFQVSAVPGTLAMARIALTRAPAEFIEEPVFF